MMFAFVLALFGVAVIGTQPHRRPRIAGSGEMS